MQEYLRIILKHRLFNLPPSLREHPKAVAPNRGSGLLKQSLVTYAPYQSNPSQSKEVLATFLLALILLLNLRVERNAAGSPRIGRGPGTAAPDPEVIGPLPVESTGELKILDLSR